MFSSSIAIPPLQNAERPPAESTQRGCLSRAAPFVGKNNALSMPYESPEITDQLLPASRRESDRGAVTEQFERAQEIFGDDVRLLPLWQGKMYVASSEEIGGCELAINPQTFMQMWQLYRKASW